MGPPLGPILALASQAATRRQSCPTFMPIPRSPRTIDTLPMKQRAAEVARQATARSVPIRNQHNALAASNSATAMPIDRCMPRMKACGSVSRSK